MTTEMMARPSEIQEYRLRHGPRWTSLDQLRRHGARRLTEDLKPGNVGRVKVKGQDYVLIHAKTFDELYGLAREISRLSNGISLVRKIALLALRMKQDKENTEIVFGILHDMTYQLPELKATPAPQHEIVFGDDEHGDEDDEAGDFELDPARVKRPAFAHAE